MELGEIQSHQEQRNYQERGVKELCQCLAETTPVWIVQVDLHLFVSVHVRRGTVAVDAWLPCFENLYDWNQLHYKIDYHSNSIESFDKV